MAAPKDPAPIPAATYTQFACIGAGFSGIGLGCTLKRWYNITDVRIFERADDLGGTWYLNQYPGCACDVPSCLYSFSFESNPDWTRITPSNDELWAYLRRVAVKYGLLDRIAFSMNVDRCEWIEERVRWRVFMTDVKTGLKSVHECQFLYSGAGVLIHPADLDVPGAETFAGPIFHTARWRKDLDLKGKEVVIFGNGCTAAQVVPAIVDDTKHLTQLIRSKHWLMPPIDKETQKSMQFINRYVPGAMWLQRWLIFQSAEDNLRGFYLTKSGIKYRKWMESISRNYVRKTAPAKYHDLLMPDFPLGCKRRIFDTGYCEALHRPNLTLSDEQVVEIVPEGVRTKDRLIKADVIVAATGFRTNDPFGDLEIVGRGGVTPAQHWEKFGGPEAYQCTVMNEFPNFFMLAGPNSVTGHTSVVLAIENSINYSLRIIKPLLDGQGTIAEIKLEPEKEWSDCQQDTLSKMVFNTGCNAWYTRGDNGKQWNASTYPYSQAHYWYRSLFPVWKDWQYRGTITKKERGNKRVITLTLFLIAIASFVRLKGVAYLKGVLAARGLLPALLSR